MAKTQGVSSRAATEPDRSKRAAAQMLYESNPKRLAYAASDSGNLVSWEHEFALSFINDGHFQVTDAGPLRAPIKDFSIWRNEGLTLMIGTRCPPDARTTEPERPPGTVRLNTQCAVLENIGGMKAKLKGVIPYNFLRTHNYRTSDSELTEEAQIHEISAPVQADGAARYTVDWVENLPSRPFQWPASINTTTEILTTRKIGPRW
jgi:hypothetical protein